MKELLGKLLEEQNDEDILKEIDWNGLAKYISDLIGVKVTVKAWIDSQGYIQWKVKEDLLKYAGIFRVGLTAVTIRNFATSGRRISTSTVSTVRERNKYWCTCGISSPSGRFGVPLFEAWYDLEKKEWTFFLYALFERYWRAERGLK